MLGQENYNVIENKDHLSLRIGILKIKWPGIYEVYVILLVPYSSMSTAQQLGIASEHLQNN